MGSSQSSQGPEADSDDDEEGLEPEPRAPARGPTGADGGSHHPIPMYKVLEQEPEILPCHASASPLSAVGTPRGPHHPNHLPSPSIKVWDPCHVLLPPPPPATPFSRAFDSAAAAAAAADPAAGGSTEVFLITHGECAANLRPDLVAGRWPAAGLTGNGERQARALAVFLKSQGVRFSKVYCSPLDRAMTTAAFVCRVIFSSNSHFYPTNCHSVGSLRFFSLSFSFRG